MLPVVDPLCIHSVVLFGELEPASQPALLIDRRERELSVTANHVYLAIFFYFNYNTDTTATN